MMVETDNKVIGMIEDFHFYSFHHEIRPLVFCFLNNQGQYFSIKVRPNDMAETLSFIKKNSTIFLLIILLNFLSSMTTWIRFTIPRKNSTKHLLSLQWQHTHLSNLDYSRVELGSDTRRRQVKLWLSTANLPQRSRWAEIGSPSG